jgi:hypothetical protein
MDGVGCTNLKTVEVDLETFFRKIYWISGWEGPTELKPSSPPTTTLTGRWAVGQAHEQNFRYFLLILFSPFDA